jgi:hypothetical protein
LTPIQKRLKVEKEPSCIQKESPVSSFMSDAASAVPPNSPTSIEVDRRVWVRYSCDLESTCHTGQGPDELSWSARVRDISRGGLNLQLNRAFEPGSILSVDMPLGPNLAPRSLLVKVVHAENQGPGNWSLGCALEKNLEEEDLLAFQVKKPVILVDDKRAWIRFSCEGERPPRATVLINPSNKIQAQILNISPGGIGLATKRPSDPGMRLQLELVDASGRISRPIQARVVRSTFRGLDDWTIDCSFEPPLTEDDLASLL